MSAVSRLSAQTATPAAHQPASKLRRFPPDRLRDRLKLAPQQLDLLQHASRPLELLNLLQQHSLLRPSTALLCYALPEREAVWWACMCVLHTAPAAFPEAQRRALDAAQAWVWQPDPTRRRDSASAAKEAGYVSAAAFAARAGFAARLSDPLSMRAGRRVEAAVRLAATWDGTERTNARLQRFIASALDIDAGGAGRLPAEATSGPG